MIRRPDGVTVLALHGELDIARTPQLRVAINDVLRQEPAGLVIDLCGMTFADSTVLALLINAQRRTTQRGIPMALACDVPRTLELLVLTRLEREFVIAPTREDALHAVAS